MLTAVVLTAVVLTAMVLTAMVLLYHASIPCFCGAFVWRIVMVFLCGQDLSLDVPVGTHMALVGPSGGGKSSVMSLACRLWDPTGGVLLLDGTPASMIDPQWLHKQIAVVLQASLLRPLIVLLTLPPLLSVCENQEFLSCTITHTPPLQIALPFQSL